MHTNLDISEKGSYLSCVTNSDFHFSTSNKKRLHNSWTKLGNLGHSAYTVQSALIWKHAVHVYSCTSEEGRKKKESKA